MYKSNKVTLEWYQSLFPLVGPSASSIWQALDLTVYNSIGHLCVIPTKSIDKLTNATSAIQIQIPIPNYHFLEKFVSDHGKYKTSEFPNLIATKVPGLQCFSYDVCSSLLRECVVGKYSICLSSVFNCYYRQ